MRKTYLALYILLLLSSITLACEKTTISAITADSNKFDGKEVCVEGLISNLKFKTSKKGNPYTTFDLNDENSKSLTVFSFGTLPIKEGNKVKVTGRYEVEKRVGRYTFYNEIDASSVEQL